MLQCCGVHRISKEVPALQGCSACTPEWNTYVESVLFSSSCFGRGHGRRSCPACDCNSRGGRGGQTRCETSEGITMQTWHGTQSSPPKPLNPNISCSCLSSEPVSSTSVDMPDPPTSQDERSRRSSIMTGACNAHVPMLASEMFFPWYSIKTCSWYLSFAAFVFETTQVHTARHAAEVIANSSSYATLHSREAGRNLCAFHASSWQLAAATLRREQ